MRMRLTEQWTSTILTLTIDWKDMTGLPEDAQAWDDDWDDDDIEDDFSKQLK